MIVKFFSVKMKKKGFLFIERMHTHKPLRDMFHHHTLYSLVKFESNQGEVRSVSTRRQGMRKGPNRIFCFLCHMLAPK